MCRCFIVSQESTIQSDSTAKRPSPRFIVDMTLSTISQEFEKSVKYLAEDPAEMGPDEFFGTLDQFLTRMSDCRGDLVVFKRREEEERRKKEAAAAAQLEKAVSN